MYSQSTGELPKGKCAEQVYRLAVYEAGHALIARALNLRILSVRMLPRPPVLISEKAFSSHNWESLLETLEIRVMELFGGQIAEEITCKSNTCCSGDVARIDELARLIAGIGDERSPDEIWFDLEDAAREIFAQKGCSDAIIPIADFLYERMTTGRELVDGKDLEALMAEILPQPVKPGRLKGVFGFGKTKTKA